jgi:tRNA(Ile)-lysidine synthase
MKKYLAAVSGGSDSMTMLDMYVRQISVVCHVNYQKRLSAKRDAEIAEQYCKSHKIIFKRLLVTKSIYDEYHKISHNFQNIARLIRYDFFTKIAHKYSLDTVLIAHNKDDFLETAIMQVQRNTAAPFIGIQTKSQYKDLNIYRPLLNV